MRSNNSGCLTAFVSSFSRIMLLMFWISRPVAWNAAFAGFIIPCLGFMFLPSPLCYMSGSCRAPAVFRHRLAMAISGFVMDIASIGAAGAANRDRIPAGVPGSMAPPQPPAGTA